MLEPFFSAMSFMTSLLDVRWNVMDGRYGMCTHKHFWNAFSNMNTFSRNCKHQWHDNWHK